MNVYHGTSINKKNLIMQNGFIESYGEYGTGIYFAVSKDLAYDYGDEIITALIDDEYIIKMDITTLPKSHADLENIALSKGYKVIMITYSNCVSSRNETEICVYDKNIIEII